MNRVFPISKLGSFSPEEVRLMLCGEQTPNWTREDIIAFTEPKLGYTRERFLIDYILFYLQYLITSVSIILLNFFYYY